MRMKLVSLIAASILLAACETAPSTTGSTGGAGTGSTSTAATTPSGPTPGSQQDLVVNVGDRVFFDFNKSDLKPEARRTLERQAAWLKQYQNVRVAIEGHCDERGTREYNLALGEKRATAVKEFLVANGVAASRLKTVSYGKERPAVLGSNEAAYAQNRRGVGVIQ